MDIVYTKSAFEVHFDNFTADVEIAKIAAIYMNMRKAKQLIVNVKINILTCK